jgi:DEAD/DEAH box helicase domain-containing protein
LSVAPDTRPWSALLDAGRADERLVREAFEGAREAIAVALPETLHPAVSKALRAAGIASLWSHQAEALESAWAGPTIVTTGTASGKSLCFNLPALDVLCRDAKARALYLYPTKALAQDQARAINAFGLTKQVRPAIYDGDTAREQRTQIRRRANLVLTNPDMLHMGILPNHRAWSTRRTSTAASSARTSRTSCAGCGGSPTPTGPSRASCSRAPRSPTRSSSPSA